MKKYDISAPRVKGQSTFIQREMAQQIERLRIVLDFRDRQGNY
jgi:hypothetical protein